MMWSDFLNSIARVTIEALFNGLWQGVALAALIGCALACHRRTNAATRHAIWLLTLVAVACLPFLRSLPQVAPTRRVTVIDREPIARPAPIRRVSEPITMPAVLRIEPPVVKPVAVVHLRNRWPVMLFGVWLFGALLMLARIGWSFVHVSRLRNASTPLDASCQDRLRQWLGLSGGECPVELRSASSISTPMSLGPVQPLILIPESLRDQLTEKEFDHVLLHELAHIRRGDNWTNLFQKLIEALLFFHPAVWWTAKKLNIERENACDDWVVALTGEPKPYAACLAKLVEVAVPAAQPVLATGIFRGTRQIVTRIERLLDERRNPSPQASWFAIAPALVLLAGIAVVCSEVRTVLAGPLANGPLARLQAAAFAAQTATP